MPYEPRDNSGSLFKNDRKTSEKHPDYSGTAVINGEEFYIDAWIKEPVGRKKFLSISFKSKGQRRQAPARELPRRPAPSRPTPPPAYEPDADPDF